ncbi:very-long-chain enoyl-CoA reductase [Elysia marginata]|uniref:Very-long-chain enoyl-CoA reductase n=1 Tax=Elysia marginata TaxID=1093978 RepID=A0AAV4HQ16_9GAST|nr:very-long-chain enoyl-CoA reductase [Elysia marginata]
MSAAFDTIDRATLLNILETIIEEDELRLVRFLLSNTCLNIRIGGTKEEKKFTSNIGTPQGDSLSPVLVVRLFGHILRRDREIPANKAMEGFFVPQGDKYRGRPITTLPVVLNNDLSLLESSTYCLKTFKDIENLKKMAEQRDQWRILCTRIQQAAEALQSDDYDAERR